MDTSSRSPLRLQTVVAVTTAILISSGVAAAQPLEWQATAGPPSGEILSSIELADGRVFAGSSVKGLFLREIPDGPWQRIEDPTFDGVQVRDLVEYDTMLVAATAGQGVFASTDGGFSWAPINNGLSSGLVYDLLVSQSGLLYAATTGGLFEYDGGSDWTLKTEAIGGGSIRTVVENSLGHLFIGEFSQGVFRSRDSGETWESASSGLVTSTIRSLDVGPNNELYAGTWGGAALQRSFDGGDSWEIANSGLEANGVWSVKIDEDGRLHAGTRGQGIFFSDDKGDSWNRAGAPIATVTRIEIGPSGALWAAARVGILTSVDGGTTWTSAGVPFSTVNDLIVVGDRLLAGTDLAGLFYSDDDGQTWVPTAINAEQIFNIQHGRDGSVLATTWQGRVYRSDTDGEDWAVIWQTFLFPFTATATSNGTVFVGTNAGIFRIAEDGNPTRVAIPDTRVRDLVAGPDDVLFAATDGEGIYRSRDLGATWEQIGLEIGIAGEVIWRLAVSPGGASAARVAAAPYESGGVWISDDGGDSWYPSDDIQKYYIQDLTVGPAEQFVAGTFSGWVLELCPDSTEWKLIEPRFNITPIWSIATGSDGTAYVGGNPVGVYLMRMAVKTSSSTVVDRLPDERAALRFELYPNPSRTQVSLVFDTADRDPRVIEVYDQVGRLVRVTRIRVSGPSVNERLDTVGLPSGQYFIRLRNEVTGSVSGVKPLSVIR